MAGRALLLVAVALVGALALLASPSSSGRSGASSAPRADVLVLTRTTGFRHDSIPAAIAALRRAGPAAGLRLRFTEDPGAFSRDGLERFEAVLFLSTTGDVLGPRGQRAFARWLRPGRGWAGVHAAADTEEDWPLYGRLLGGARFRSHPAVQPATLRIEDRRHPATRRVPRPWSRTDEWYAFRANPRPRVHVLARLDERTYDPGADAMGDHPIAWCDRVSGGRVSYTGLGHTTESWREPALVRHVLGGLRFAAGLTPAGRCDDA